MKQLTLYFSLAYFISWLIWLPLYGHIFGISNLPVLPFNHALGGLGPMIAAFIVTYIFEKKQGLLRLVRRLILPRPLSYVLIALFSPFLLVVTAVIINAVVNHTAADFSGLLRVREFPAFNLLTFFGYNLLFFGFGEEVGWRGFALPRFQNKLNALNAGVLLTFFWAFWHWPLFFYRPGYTSMDIAGIVGWLLSLLTGSILLSWLYNSSRGSILACAIFHATIDIAFTADIADKNVVGITGFLITMWGILIVVIFKWNNLSRQEREKCEL